MPNADFVISAGLKATLSSPLNQNGWPAASLAPCTFVPLGRSSGVMSPPLAGRSTLWNPLGVKRTLSPTRIVTPCGKKSFTSTGRPSGTASRRGRRPMLTALVFAWARPGIASTTPAAMHAVAGLQTFTTAPLDV